MNSSTMPSAKNSVGAGYLPPKKKPSNKRVTAYPVEVAKPHQSDRQADTSQLERGSKGLMMSSTSMPAYTNRSPQTYSRGTSSALMMQRNKPDYSPPPNPNMGDSDSFQATEYQSIVDDAHVPAMDTPQTEFQENEYQSDGYTGVQGNTNYTYDPREESLVQNQIAGLLDPNSALMRKAISQANNYSASRGLQSSSIGSEAALSSMVEKALPIAQQDASTYANADQAGWQHSFTSEQNNLSRQHDAAMFDKQGRLQIDLQNNQLDFQNNQANADRQMQSELEQLKYQQSLGLLDAQGKQRMNELNAQNQFASEMQDLKHKQNLGLLDAEGKQRMKELEAQHQNQLGSMDRQAQLQKQRDTLIHQFDMNKLDKAYLQDLQKTQLTWERDDAVFARNLGGQERLQYQNASADSYNQYLARVSEVYSNPNMTPQQQTNAVNTLKQMFSQQRQQLQMIYGFASPTNQTGKAGPYGKPPIVQNEFTEPQPIRYQRP